MMLKKIIAVSITATMTLSSICSAPIHAAERLDENVINVNMPCDSEVVSREKLLSEQEKLLNSQSIEDYSSQQAHNILSDLTQKGFVLSKKTIDSLESGFSEKSLALNLFENDNLDIALKEGFNFLLNTNSTTFIDDVGPIKDCIMQNALLKECIESTLNYITSDIPQGDKQFEILKRLNSLKKLMEIDKSIPSNNSFFKFVSSMKNAYQVLISRRIANQILENSRASVEKKLSSQNVSRNADISASIPLDGANLNISITNESSETSSEKSFYKIDNSTGLRCAVGTGLQGYLGIEMGNNLQVTRTLIFHSLEQFLDANTIDGKISSIELRAPEIKNIIKSRKVMQKNEKNLLSTIKSSIEWFLKSTGIVPQNLNLSWPNITATTSSNNEFTFTDTLDINASAKFLASLGFNVSTDSGITSTRQPHSYLSLIDEDCSPSSYVTKASDILAFLKTEKCKKYNEIKEQVENYLLGLNKDENLKLTDEEISKVLSIIVSNIKGDIRLYISALSVLSDKSSAKQERADAKELKHKIEKDWLTTNKLLRLSKGRLEMLKAAIAIASYMREFAVTESDINMFKALYMEIEHLAQMQTFSSSLTKQKAEFSTSCISAFNNLNFQTKLDVPVVGTTFLNMSYSDQVSECKFDTSKDFSIQFQLPMVENKVYGTEKVKNKLKEIIAKISKDEKSPMASVLKESLSLIDNKFESILSELGIKRIIGIPFFSSFNNYLSLNFYLTKIDKTNPNSNQIALPEQDSTIIKLNDEWVLKLIKRIDSGVFKINPNINSPVSFSFSDRVGKASSKIGNNTFSFITNKYNVFESGLKDRLNSDSKVSNLWLNFKTNQEDQLKELFKNVTSDSKNAKYELQCIFNDIMQNLKDSQKLSKTEKNQLILETIGKFSKFISACGTFAETHSANDYSACSQLLDDILKLNYCYSYMPEYNRAFSINKAKIL